MGGNSTTRNARIVHSVAFDAWFAYTGETTAPRPVTRREDTLLEETLYEEELLPVRLEFPILSLNPGLRPRCVAPDVWPALSRA